MERPFHIERTTDTMGTFNCNAFYRRDDVLFLVPLSVSGRGYPAHSNQNS